MDSVQIFYPVFVLIGLTLVMGIRLYRMRVRAVMKDGLNPTFFKYNRGGKPPEYMLRSEQNFSNLLEMPQLFYVVVVISYVTHQVNVYFVVLAWLYVLTRLAHTWVHTRINKLILRRNWFMAGYAVLIVYWVSLLVQLVIH